MGLHTEIVGGGSSTNSSTAGISAAGRVLVVGAHDSMVLYFTLPDGAEFSGRNVAELSLISIVFTSAGNGCVSKIVSTS